MKKVPPIHDSQTLSVRPRPAEHRELVLYVEDDDENWDVAEYRLGQAYNMLRAATSEQACRLVRERGPELSAILMDIELRGSELNGIELTELFRGKRRAGELPSYARDFPLVSKPIIFVTAHGARYTDVELMLFGADKVISKPVNFTALNLALTSLSLTQASRGR